VGGDIVVWSDQRKGDWYIYGYDLSTGREFQITDTSVDASDISIYGSIVVCHANRSGNVNIYGYDFSEGTARSLSPSTSREDAKETWDIRNSILALAIMLIAAVITIYQFFKNELLAKIRREKRQNQS
jgi:beta propeller repeat protein